MREMTVRELKDALGGSLLKGSENEIFYDIVRDSREAEAGKAFFAIKGVKNDGHDYLPQVLDSGCRVLVVSDPVKTEKALEGRTGVTAVFTEDTTKALQTMGTYYLESLSPEARIGVTGSVGKTSTRDFLYYVFSRKYKTARSIKNYNNEYGLPLSLLSFPGDTEAAIIEMGMEKKGSIGFLADLSHPQVGVITNVGISHIENFPEEGRNGILNTKLEITKNFNDDSVLIVNWDDEMLHGLDLKERGIKGRIIKVGSTEDCDFIVRNIDDRGTSGMSFDIEHEGVAYHCDLPVPGAHNAFNSGLAIAAGSLYGISMEEAIKGLSEAGLTEKRLAIKEKDGIIIIDDTYNAAPDSLKSAIRTLMNTPCPEGGRHIVISGDMYELGSEAASGHSSCGAFAYDMGVDVLIAIGELSKNTQLGWIEAAEKAGHKPEKMAEVPLVYVDKETGRAAEHFDTKEPVIEGIMDHVHPGDRILVKASRGMALEAIVNRIINS